jgi:hypothetical protein
LVILLKETVWKSIWSLILLTRCLAFATTL